MRLQWPHQGAKNLTNTDLPETAASQVSFVNSVAPAEVTSVAAERAKAIAFMAIAEESGARDQCKAGLTKNA